MVREMSRTDRRLEVIVNYLCVAAVALLVHVGSVMAWNMALRLVGISAAVAVGFVTFVRVYWRTRLWKLAHAPFRQLDERQAQVMYDSLSHSYGIFTIACLVIIYLNAVVEEGPIPILVVGSVLYLAHTLPSAVVAWNEKEVLIGD